MPDIRCAPRADLGLRVPARHIDALAAACIALAYAIALSAGSAQAQTPLAAESPGLVEGMPLPRENAETGADTAIPESSDAATESGAPAVELLAPTETTVRPGTLDRVHGAISTGILATAEWLDSFFDDPRFAAEENRTRLKVGADYFLERGSGPDFSAPVSARLRLPHLENKARLVVVGTPQQDVDGRTPIEGTAATRLPGAQDNNVTTALDYFFWQTDRHNLATRVGIRFREGEPETFIQPRYRYLLPLDPWAFRFTQEFRWWTEFGWEETTTVDFERSIGETLFFRTSAQGAWSEQEDGYFYSLSFVLRQPLSARRVLQYEWINSFQTHPANQLQEVLAVVRYRQRFWRDWMFYEIAPQASFRRERDFDVAPGILFRLEMIFGWYEGDGV